MSAGGGSSSRPPGWPPPGSPPPGSSRSWGRRGRCGGGWGRRSPAWGQTAHSKYQVSSELFPARLSYAIKTQLEEPKAPY